MSITSIIRIMIITTITFSIITTMITVAIASREDRTQEESGRHEEGDASVAGVYFANTGSTIIVKDDEVTPYIYIYIYIYIRIHTHVYLLVMYIYIYMYMY